MCTNKVNYQFCTSALPAEHFSTRLCELFAMLRTPHTNIHTCTRTQDGYSPLYCASQEGHDNIVEMLLQAGAKVDLWTEVNNAEALAITFLRIFFPQFLF